MQFQTSHIPTDIDTYEKLACWISTILVAHGGALDYNERVPNVAAGDSGIQAVFESFGPQLSHQKDNRIIFRLALLLEENHASSAYTMDYQACKEILTMPVSVDYINS